MVLFLSFRQRPAVGSRCEVAQGRQLPGNRGRFHLVERIGALLECRALTLEERYHLFGLILGYKADEEGQIPVFSRGLSAYKLVLVPQAVELTRLIIVQEEALERLIFAMKHLQIDYFI